MKPTTGRRIFLSINTVVLSFMALLCLIPVIHILALSLSERAVVSAGLVSLLPINFTTASYKYVLQKNEFWDAMLVSIKRIILGGGLSIPITIMTAYPLSKSNKKFKQRSIYAWFFIFTILFHGGLIPSFMLIRGLKLIDSIWALVLPSVIQVYNIIMLMNFFRGLPDELEEAAFMDGAGHMRILWKIFVPISTAGIATITLFTMVGHWNEWFAGIIYMNRPKNYPLQSYLQTIVVQRSLSEINIASTTEMEELLLISDRTFKAAQIFIGMVPILCVYPFLQKYFMKGIVLGSVKG